MCQFPTVRLHGQLKLDSWSKVTYYRAGDCKIPNSSESIRTKTATITLGAQSSGDDDRTDKHILELRRLLVAHCEGPYSDEISEFALVLRIGGNIQEFDFEGCERIRRNRKSNYITVDLGFPSRRWRGLADNEIRKYLADIVETGLLCCLHRLKKDKVRVREAALMRDFTEVKRRFLGIP